MLAQDAEATQVETLSTMHLGTLGSARPRSGPGSRGAAAHKEQPLLERATAAVAESPHFVLLDFRRVHGLDATAARTLGTLASTLVCFKAPTHAIDRSVSVTYAIARERAVIGHAYIVLHC